MTSTKGTNGRVTASKGQAVCPTCGAAVAKGKAVAKGNGRHSAAKHIAEAFAHRAEGTFLTVSQIANFHSREYGSSRPSSGTIDAALHGQSVPEGITPCYWGESEVFGAVKGTIAGANRINGFTK